MSEERENYQTQWTTVRLAEATGLTSDYVRQLLNQGVIKGEKVGRDWLVSDSEARRWMASRKSKD